VRDFHPLRMFTPKRTRDGALRRPRPRSAGGMKHAELKQHSGSRCARVPHVHSAPVGRGDAPAGRPYLAGAESNARFMASTHVHTLEVFPTHEPAFALRATAGRPAPCS